MRSGTVQSVRCHGRSHAIQVRFLDAPDKPEWIIVSQAEVWRIRVGTCIDIEEEPWRRGSYLP
jgi:hypothetical protein